MAYNERKEGMGVGSCGIMLLIRGRNNMRREGGIYMASRYVCLVELGM